MFTDYGKLSKKISLLMWKLDRHIISWAFTIYKINETKEKRRIDDKVQELQDKKQFRNIVGLRRRLLRCLDEVKPSIQGDFPSFIFFTCINCSLYLLASATSFLKVFLFRCVTVMMKAALAEFPIAIQATSIAVIQKMREIAC